MIITYVQLDFASNLYYIWFIMTEDPYLCESLNCATVVVLRKETRKSISFNYFIKLTINIVPKGNV